GVVLEVEVRVGGRGVAGASHVADDLAGRHLDAGGDAVGDAVEVGVVEAVTGVGPHPDGDATEGAPRPGAGDRAVVDRRHRRSPGGHHVHPLVCPATGTGSSPTVHERHRALHRARLSPARRRGRLGGRRRFARLVGAPAGGRGGGRRRRVVTAAGGRGGGRRAGGGRRGEPRLLF